MKLFDQLTAIKDENLVSFHVPGHKYTELYKPYLDRLDSILDIDVTEIPGTDDLFDPESCIKESQDELSNLLDTKESYYLVGGTTSGIYAMIMSAVQPGDTLLVARDCHRAVYDGLFLGQINAVYINPIMAFGIPMGITPSQVEKAIQAHPHVKGLVLTYPNYYGIGSDLKAIKAVLDKYNIMLIVDEAHGAHLFLSSDLMPSALEIGADIVVQSSHKSLPVMTQASVLHLNSDRISQNKLEMMLKLHQTSSPSYLLMSSLDIGYDISKKEGKRLMENLLEEIKRIKKKHKLFLIEEDLPDGFSLDPTKLTLLGSKYNIDPISFEEMLRMNGIQIEFSNDKVGVLVTSIMNTQKDFDYLIKTMEMLKFKCYSGIDTIVYSDTCMPKLSINEAYYGVHNQIKLEDACGKIAAQYIIPYPPGIPLIIPGEMFEEDKIELIKEMLAKKNNISGIESMSDKINILAD
ncbi:aminotransferase class I/II-fold pyridoxal phosphate-dependent enzyme [Acidaminobacter sp. JC074]|uniref:aminotransferase class I/II-fold pyridoxal phosphate-dependent enzyme n=1 Tax=Acidaminobacter sp. JC074 TaxID=2530199 RepID=UPI001F109794|nr:aminotransferase class I/II-fold pyridoxal phosphate-dependent enzyme [Acidaminobacter sp. JC074]MCH4887375.1 aminotransferase class I/II-fold pyridoxal phosphate-dependent enzyme [Acidaminobacter sp. JC074]